jgi:hypothetical protein
MGCVEMNCKNSVLAAFLVFLMLGSVSFAAIIGTFQNAPATGPNGCTNDYAISSPSVADGFAGKQLTIHVTVTSKGTCSGAVDIIMSVPTGWAFSKISSLSLDAGQTKAFDAVINIPTDAKTGTVTFGAVMNGKGVASSTTVNIVEPVPEKAQTQPGTQAASATGLATAAPVSDMTIVIVFVVIIIIAALYFSKFGKKKK